MKWLLSLLKSSYFELASKRIIFGFDTTDRRTANEASFRSIEKITLNRQNSQFVSILSNTQCTLSVSPMKMNVN